MQQFNHLHCHTQFSLLDGATNIKSMVAKAKADGMQGVAMTDHGNMFGAFQLVNEAEKVGIKPIIGCELYLVNDRHKQKFSKQDKDKRYHQLVLAKNEKGYQNLSKLCSLGYKEGLYSKYPRVDKELIEKYAEGLIATSCCIGAEIPQTILFEGERSAEEKLKWWINIFGKEDYYIELQRHDIEDFDKTGISQENVNQILLKFAKKYDLKVIATNDSHYLDEEDSDIHDILLCINTGNKKNTPIGEGKNFRFGFPNNKFYFKSQKEMNALFSDIPQALDYTNEIVNKITPLNLKRDILLPAFPLPPSFKDQNEYLRYLVFQGAKERYTLLTPEIDERINFELGIIEKMGFPGYFLIVQDFIIAAKERSVVVGPGRGSVAGSLVAYCIGITNIDPIKYNLLFERFLNPERVSMPDIDIDFDDEGRQTVIDYVVEKYGKNQVAQIITYGRMAAKMSIRDVARVMDLPLKDSNYLAKLVPEKPGTTLQQAFKDIQELQNTYQNKEALMGQVLHKAEGLEGSIRNTGIHAAGIIIAPDNIMNYIPICTTKETDLLVTQFEGKIIEDVGMLKMDFLGLKTLSIIKTTLDIIKDKHDINIDIDTIPLNDKKTFKLYQSGHTISTFQFESEGMRMYLKELKPTNLEDLIAMNALYRPGPMQFIPSYIARKHGKEKVNYPHAILKPILEPTFGIMIYQEQIMQSAQIMAGYSLGQADLLRRAMGKKNMKEMKKQRQIFVKGAWEQHSIRAKKAEEVFGIMEKFAEYGFNRSHSAAYSVIAYQTAYLKANYSSEYMAAVLDHNSNSMDNIKKFIDETQKMNIKIFGPDINESNIGFSVNKSGAIRFGLGAVKGVGKLAAEDVINNRKGKGIFPDIYNFVERINLRNVSKKTFESLGQGGAFDSFQNVHRAQLLETDQNDKNGIERLIKYGNYIQNEATSNQNSLFGSAGNKETLPVPKFPQIQPYTKLRQLEQEKEVTGFYISGHPLDDFKYFIKSRCKNLGELENFTNQNVSISGIVTKVNLYTGKDGKTNCALEIEDYHAKLFIRLFNRTYESYSHLLKENERLFLTGQVRQWRDGSRWDFATKTIESLEKMNTVNNIALNISINLNKFKDEQALNFIELVRKYPGKNLVYLNVTADNHQENMAYSFKVGKYKVDLKQDFFDKLEKIKGLNF